MSIEAIMAFLVVISVIQESLKSFGPITLRNTTFEVIKKIPHRLHNSTPLVGEFQFWCLGDCRLTVVVTGLVLTVGFVLGVSSI